VGDKGKVDQNDVVTAIRQALVDEPRMLEVNSDG